MKIKTDHKKVYRPKCAKIDTKLDSWKTYRENMCYCNNFIKKTHQNTHSPKKIKKPDLVTLAGGTLDLHRTDLAMVLVNK
jgi:hypothetical protein